MSTSDRIVQKIILGFIVVISLGLFATWVSSVQEKKNFDNMRKSEMRIGQIRDECTRRMEEAQQSWNKELDRRVELKSNSKLADLDIRHKGEMEDTKGELNMRIDKLKSQLKDVTEERNKIEDELSEITKQFKAYKEKMEGEPFKEKSKS